MRSFGDWSLGAKTITLSAVCLLLAIGLCAHSAPLEGGGTPFQNFATAAGLLLLAIAALLFVASLVMFFVAWAKKPSGNDQSRKDR